MGNMQPSNRTSRGWAKSALFASLLTSIAIGSGGTIVAQTTKKPSAAKSLPGKSATEAGPRFKAIWEPVNVKEDLQLMSVYFATADEGWVAGGGSGSGGGVIVHTKDGGANWDVQLGDPQSSDRPYHQLRFVNARVGFAAQSTSSGDHQLLRTTDGQTWAPVGKLAQHRSDYRFISAEAGLLAGGGGIQRTQDAGRTWKQVYVCRIKAEINGLTQDVGCHIAQVAFVDANVAYAMSQSIGAGAGFVMAKTMDGGTTWSSWLVLPGEEGSEGALHFLDANTGVLRTINGKVFRTIDGGKTWTGVTGNIGGKPAIGFADAEVGWMMAYRMMLYTTNGGKSWVSREIPFPASVNAFSLVKRDRGYAVGEHGMVYRYRIVPADYTSKGMLAAPAMTSSR